MVVQDKHCSLMMWQIVSEELKAFKLVCLLGNLHVWSFILLCGDTSNHGEVSSSVLVQVVHQGPFVVLPDLLLLLPHVARGLVLIEDLSHLLQIPKVLDHELLLLPKLSLLGIFQEEVILGAQKADAMLSVQQRECLPMNLGAEHIIQLLAPLIQAIRHHLLQQLLAEQRIDLAGIKELLFGLCLWIPFYLIVILAIRP